MVQTAWHWHELRLGGNGAGCLEDFCDLHMIVQVENVCQAARPERFRGISCSGAVDTGEVSGITNKSEAGFLSIGRNGGLKGASQRQTAVRRGARSGALLTRQLHSSALAPHEAVPRVE